MKASKLASQILKVPPLSTHMGVKALHEVDEDRDNLIINRTIGSLHKTLIKFKDLYDRKTADLVSRSQSL